MNRLLIAVVVLSVQATVQAFAQDSRTARATGNNMFPQWSHDGKRIAFTSDRDGDPEIYVMEADGTNPRRLTQIPGRDAHPFFSRDGKKIVFQSPRANGVDTNIYVMNSDGSNVVKLTDLKGFAGVPVYSPDQKRIVFQWRETNNFADDSKWRICLMNSDGSDFRVITPGMANDQVPNWSRDGKRLLFYSDRTGKDQIYTMKPDGSDVRVVAASDFNDNAAFWSPDNSKIAFTSDRDGNRELYLMDSNGKNKRRLTNSRATERAGVWAPDGSRLAFSSDGDGPAHIYVTTLDGAKVVCLTEKQKGDSVLLVSLIGERQVAVIDPVTQDVLARFPSPQGPHEITLSADAKLAYVSDSGSGPNTPSGNSIIVLDLRTLSVKNSFKTCEKPHDTRVSRNGRILWVACAPAKAVLELDAVTGAVRKTWDTKLDGGWFVEITPDGRKIFVPHLEGKAFSMIDRTTSQVRKLVSGNTIFGVAASPRGNEIWISDSDENKLSVVNAATGAVTASVSLAAAKQGESSFSRLRFTPDGERVVVVRNSEFVIVDAARRSIVSTIRMPHAGKVVTVSGDSRHAFVSHPAADSVSVINLVNGNVERTFVVGKQPDGIAWAPTSRF